MFICSGNIVDGLIKDGLLGPMNFDGFTICESCLEGKMTK